MRAKIRALISRQTAQSWDIFDLYLFLPSRVEKLVLPDDLLNHLNEARDNIFSMDFAIFKSQVISYLEPEDQPLFDSEEVWDSMRIKVVEALEEVRS